MSRGVFVTGTDTGVGKTTVSCALLSALVQRGHRVAAMKPCETGNGDDGERLAEACGRPLDPSLVRPYQFALPASPEAAAAAANQPYVNIDNIRRAYSALCADAEAVLVEGAGGLLVPLNHGHTMADLAAALQLPLLIVARPSLGTVNHTLLTIEAARHRGLTVAGVIFSRSGPDTGPEEPWTPSQISRHGKVKILATLPFGGDFSDGEIAAIWSALQIQPRNL